MIENPASPSAWKARLDLCKKDRREHLAAWSENVDYRRGKPFAVASDLDRVNVNLDWSLTKAKHAQLFSQVPSVILTPANTAAQVSLNKELTRANVGAAIDEAVIDAINASGIGAVMVRYEAKTEDIEVPAVDPLTAQMLQAAGQEVPTTTATRTTSTRYALGRFSPSDLLWDTTFTGSDFDQAPWIGRSGRMFWAEGKPAFNLQDEDKERILSGGDTHRRDSLRDDSDKRVDALVEYDEIFYWSYKFNPEEKYFDAIRRLVFVAGLDKPVIDEPWNGQKFDPQTGIYAGACQFPIRVLTLSYISDDAIPPSDSAIGRPQVNELIRSRSQLMAQRDNSKPLRYFDPTRIDPTVQVTLMRGTWQGMVPIQGDGSRAIGEVARASYPREDHELDRIAKSDLSEQWSLGSNQLGQFASGERSATEAGVIARGNESRIGYERKRVEKFFVGIARILAGLMALYGEQFPPIEDLTIRPDSTVLLDADSRLRQLAQFLNLTAKSGYYDVAPVIAEMAALANAHVEIKPPTPPKPEAPKVSLNLSGEDLLNPISIAMLLESGQGPTPKTLDAAKVLIANLSTPPQVAPAPQGPPQGPDLSQMGPGLERITKRQEEV